MNLGEKNILVVGMGKTGLSAANYLKDKCKTLHVWDDNEKRRKELKKLGFDYLKEITDLNFKELDLIIWSPGIPHTYPKKDVSPIATLAKKNKVPLMSDINLFYLLNPKATYVGITGSNGKSTTTALVNHILKELGKEVYIGGNFGVPVFDLPELKKSSQIVVLELSSYQLELSPDLKLKTGALINITPDHLNRHGGMKGYVSAKELITRMTDTLVYGAEDEYTKEIAKRFRGTKVPVSLLRKVKGVFIKDQKLINNTTAAPRAYLDLSELKYLKGEHNAQNIGIAFALVKALNFCGRRTAKAISTFKGLAHRQEFVKKVGKLTFINDSKATNAEATIPALKTYDNIYLIAGGMAKEGGIENLKPYMDGKKIRGMFFIGRDGGELYSYAKDFVPSVKCGKLKKAVSVAVKTALKDIKTGAIKDATILLSPACASWDQFDSFEHRGDTFKELVKEYK